MTPHIIRLRDPWQWAPEAGTGNARASRWFNRPTGLEPNTQVVLVVAGIEELSGVRLNDHFWVDQPESGADWEWELGERLELRNLLQLVFITPETDDAEQQLRAFLTAGNVRLEIFE